MVAPARNGGALVKWIRALDLQRWSEAIQARTSLPEMVADLIRASSQDIGSFRFPSGDKGQVRGFDGRLESRGAPPFVPEGRSIWEFGVSDGVAKAEKDYRKRTKEVPEEERKKTVFVFATLQTWDNPKQKLDEWISEKRQLGEWKDVVYLDGVALEHWLERNPAVSARFARFELKLLPQNGAISTDEFWDTYSNRFRPQLTTDVLLCDRREQADKIIQALSSGPSRIPFAADSPVEVIAFAVAAIRSAQVDVRLFLESRTLIVETEDAGRALLVRGGVAFFPRGQARVIAGALATVGPTLAALGADQPNGDAELLLRPSNQSLARALETMGFDADGAYQLARSCGRSVTILSRFIPGGVPFTPDWVPEARKLVPAILAGGWDAKSSEDQDIIARLAGGQSYFEYESELRPFRRMQDPPLDQEKTIWKIRAPVDAFVHVGHLIGPEDLARLEAAAKTVFSDVIQPPNPDELFSANPPRTLHSSWLRDGIATTLLMIAALSE
jgi:hypothetical protein